MSAYISTTIVDYDVEGSGKTIDEALEAIAKQCDNTAEELTRTGDELRKAAERFRRMARVDLAPRCSLCGGLCVDLAKDENGHCPKCVEAV